METQNFDSLYCRHGSTFRNLNAEIADPSFWALNNLGIDLYDNEIEIINAVCDLNIKYLAVLSSRGSGKTFSCSLGIIKLCLDHPRFRIGVFGPKADQAERIIKEISANIIVPSSKIFKEINWEKSSGSRLSFLNGSEISAMSASETSQSEGPHFHVIVGDECVTGDTLITLADGSRKTIKEIVDQKLPVQVLSFDEKQNKLVRFEVTDFKKIPLKKQLLEIEFENGTTIKCTEDHKFYTRNRGWVEAKNLTKVDDLIIAKICECCGVSFIPIKEKARFCNNKCYLKWFEEHNRKEDRVCKQCNKVFRASKKANAQFCSAECEKTRVCKHCKKFYIRVGAEKYCSRECKVASRTAQHKPKNQCRICGKTLKSRTSTHCNQHRNWTETTGVSVINKCKNCNKAFIVVDNRKLTCSKECHNILSSIRMTQDNPTDNPETIKKMKESLQTFWEENPDKLAERLKNFKNAPVYTRGKITSPERTIITMDIPNLKYTGNGTRWVKFSTGKNKNPDFSFENSNKVVEVGDYNYWHTKQETDEVIRLYKEKRIDCLYLDADFVNENPIEAEKQIRSFLCI